MTTLKTAPLLQAECDQTWFVECLKNSSLVERLKKIKLVISDIDGSVTDGRLLFTEKDEGRLYSVINGYAVVEGQKKGLKIAFLSGNHGPSIVRRAERLKIPLELCELGHSDSKVEACKRLQSIAQVSQEEALMWGDDALDLGVKPYVSLFAVPASSFFYIQNEADFVVPRAGGDSALRLLLDLLLYVQDKHPIQAVLKKQLQGK